MNQGHKCLVGALGVVILVAALVLVVAGAQGAIAADTIIYVDAEASGDNNGTTWGDAHTQLQPALEAAADGDEIWVAEGTYTPTWQFDAGDPRSATFQMKNGVAIYGGFDPSVGDIAWEDRDWMNHETILSGDLNGDDGPDFENNDENSYHVFYHPLDTDLDGSAILDGFTITGGNAIGVDWPDWGGGMSNHGSSPTLTNCIFSGNWAQYAGGMHNWSSSPTVTNCTFLDNSAGGDGGGMYNDNASSPALTDCTFEGNSADWGGGMFTQGDSSPVLANCTFAGNSAATSGGGMVNWGNGAELTNCTFVGNWALERGGGVYNFASISTLTNCTFEGNSAGGMGGGMLNHYCSPMLTNCTFEGNSAYHGGGMGNIGASPTVMNCIFWEDIPDEIDNDDLTNLPIISYSDIQGGCDAIQGADCGMGNIDADPLFVDAGAGDLRLQDTSPVIDAGDNSAPELAGVTTDRVANPRFVDVIAVVDTGNGEPPIVDMGAYEALPGVIFVDEDASGANDGSSWNNAYTTLQPALDAAVEGDQIWVAEGVYRPTQETSPGDPRSATFQLKNGVAIYGGFDASMGDIAFEDRDWVANESILSGDLNGDDAPDFANNDENSYHVVTGSDTSVLDGFTITCGNANDSGPPHESGGGMYIYALSPTVTNCSFKGNSAGYGGGGMYTAFGSPTVTNCIFANNSAPSGAGMYNDSSSPVLTNCTFSGNSGDGMFNFFASQSLTNCILWGNTPQEIYSFAGPGIVTYSDIRGGHEGEGNINADPLFVDPGNGDYHLRPDSPCIDAGTNGAEGLSAYDFEGDDRVLDGDGDGDAIVDMGVDEAFWHPPVYLPVVLRGY